MPLPFIVGAVAAGAAAAGVGSGVKGAKKMKDANETMKLADKRHNENFKKFEITSEITNEAMDRLGLLQLKVLQSFETFSDTIEKIQNRPKFAEYSKDGVEFPTYDKETLKKVSVGAGVLLGGAGGAAAGTIGGFAAAGATTSAVMALGTASTGTAIASLSGAAATNATLAALGGGAIAAGGGGIALGTAVLGAATAGIGILVGGAIFNITGGKLSDKADEAWRQMEKAERSINEICRYLDELRPLSETYRDSILLVKNKYETIFNGVYEAVNYRDKTDWYDFTKEEKLATENSILLVGLLYKMCQVNLVNKVETEGEVPTVNKEEVGQNIRNANEVLEQLI